MKVAIRCIYNKAVKPSCDIVYMDKETWDRFRFELHNRRQIALKLLGKEQMDTYIKEIVWIPLDNQDKLLIAPGCDPMPDNK